MYFCTPKTSIHAMSFHPAANNITAASAKVHYFF